MPHSVWLMTMISLVPKNCVVNMAERIASSSTSSNLQIWSVVAVEERERKEQLSQLAGNQAHIRQCPLFLVWLVDLARLTHIAERRGLPHEGLDYVQHSLLLNY